MRFTARVLVCLAVLFSVATSLIAADSDRRTLRKYKGPYVGSWKMDGMKLPLTLRMPKKGEGKGGGKFEATPCDSDDGLSPLTVKITDYKLSRNGRKLVSRGKATWERSKIPQLGGPNPSGKLKLVAKLRGNKPVAKGRMKAGPKRGRVNVMKKGIVPVVPTPWMEMVWVGNPGNRKDAGNTAGPGVYGAVGGDFKIGKYEVTNLEYATFLNAVAAADPKGLYDSNMGTDPRGGITQLGTSLHHTYLVRPNMPLKPVNFVSFWDACRFCNWLHNGRPTGAQDAQTTEFGAYDLTVQANLDNNTVKRLPGAKTFIPTENQWYKAAYHQPASVGGPGDHYWLYPTRSNLQPTVATADSTGNINNENENIANYNRGADWNGEDGNVTTVGSGGPGSASLYGAFDMGGNVLEWNDAVASPSFRGLRGGSWFYAEYDLRSSDRSDLLPGSGLNFIGFRVASP